MTAPVERIQVLVVEDAPSMRLLLTHAIESDPRLVVAAAVASAEDALAYLVYGRPDVILMDIHLPGISGFEATRQIMHSRPVPIVICSAVEDSNDVATTFEAMEAGALAVLPKPSGPGSPHYDTSMERIVETLRLMAEVKVVRRWRRPERAGTPAGSVPPAAAAIRRNGAVRLVAIGTSTGGPPVLRTILDDLPKSFPVPIVVVQHIAPGFLQGLVDWLAQSCALPIHIAMHGERPLPGHVYFAPDRFHLGIGPQGQLTLSQRAEGDVLCPSVSHLFHSVLAVHGATAIGVLLTGMGKDGARELALLKQQGATTIVQDKETSVVHGMPGEAIRLDGATFVVPAHEVAPTLKRILAQQAYDATRA